MIPGKYEIIRLLGKGKSGNSYLVNYKGREFVLKEMHNEEVFYYKFEKPKIELELNAYPVLKELNINIPELIDYDRDNSFLLKEYIIGETVAELLGCSRVSDEMILEMLRWEGELKKKWVNIDYFPTNFVFNGSTIYYIDYEFNAYSEEWNFSNWGIYYWLNNDGFKKFLETKNPSHININGTGRPVINSPFLERRTKLLNTFHVNISLYGANI